MTKRTKFRLFVLFFGLEAGCGGGGGGGDADPPPPPPARPDVAIAVDAPDTTTPGAAIEYRVTISNDGTAGASNVAVALALPGDFMPDSISDGGAVSAGVVEWAALETLETGGEAVFTVAGSAPPVGPLLAEASAALDETDGAAGNNTATARTVLTFEALGPVLAGEADGDFFGVVADYVGDIDGDGAGDFIVGAKFADGGGGDAGALYVYSGAAVAGGSDEALGWSCPARSRVRRG